MSVSFRVAGTWAELTADGAVAIPSTPQAGDRMYLFARWKDFSVTATVTDWTELVEFADGAVSSGNGTGSVKVGCWWRNWQLGDSNPTIDFSANPTNASVVIIVMAKEASDEWLTPVAVTAAMTNWTTTSQSVSASATVAVPSSGVVMGLIGIRDDTATMTRPTNGIDDAGGLVTWNGDYVESPATHHSTTTGEDGAADLGYRLVAAGATATLRMTGTISAAETGVALWVVQGVEVNLAVADGSHGHSAENVALTQVHGLVVQDANHAHSATSPVLTQVHTISAQDAAHSHESTNTTLTQVHSITVQDAAHAHASDSPTVAVIHHLEIQNATHAHSVESLSLTQEHSLVVDDAIHSHTAENLVVKTISIVFIDPGGDAVQAVGYFNTEPGGSTGDVTFDNTQQVNGVGSYKFDSGAGGDPAYVFVPGVMGAARRVSAYFRYDLVPDVVQSVEEFVTGGVNYSGGGFANSGNLQADDESYETATPAQNSGQGSVFSTFGLQNAVLPDYLIESVKIIYERKYDVDTSIGISRVKWRVDGEEGPDHDNTDEPLTDTVVEVDVTGDRQWEPQHLTDEAFEVIAEARRGNTVTEHTQSWDYVKVEVVYRPPTTIMQLQQLENIVFYLTVIPRDSGVVLRLVESPTRNFFDGITRMLPNTDYRISFSYVVNAADDLDIKAYVDSIEELSLEAMATQGADLLDPALSSLHYGWVHFPGVDRICWFDQLYIDDGDDLTDPGNVLSTAKLPATVNEDNWNTTVGTGAVNERPISETNYRQETRALAVRQTYTLQTASAGDVDISGEVLVGCMGWAWAKRGTGGAGESLAFIVNGVEVLNFFGVPVVLSTTPSLIKAPVTSSSYPSDAAGVGMVSNDEIADTFMFEIGTVVAYRGPEGTPLLEFQLLAEDSITPASDDVSVENPDTYAIQSEVAPAPGATVTTTIFSTDSAGTPHQQAVIESTGGEETGRAVIAPGEEVSVSVEVTGADAEVGLTRTLNVD